VTSAAKKKVLGLNAIDVEKYFVLNTDYQKAIIVNMSQLYTSNPRHQKCCAWNQGSNVLILLIRKTNWKNKRNSLIPFSGSDLLLKEKVDHIELHEVEALKKVCDPAYEKSYDWELLLIRDRDRFLISMLWTTGARYVAPKGLMESKW
jgi:hypothetical protein